MSPGSGHNTKADPHPLAAEKKNKKKNWNEREMADTEIQFFVSKEKVKSPIKFT